MGGPTNTARNGKISRIAVLPFKPLISGDRNEALELGMSDALIDKLNGAEGISVTPLSSVRRFGSLEQDPTEAGRQLEVDAVLDGSIQTNSDRIRISVRLLQVESRKQLWSQQFDEKIVDIFSVQDSISQRVADALKARLGVKRHYTDNAEAYGLYLKARYLSQRASLPELRSAIGYLETALKLDPNFVPAYVVMADVYRATVLIGDEDPAVAMPIAKSAAFKAVALDDSFAEAHAALGWTIFWYDHDWAAAETELRRAIELDPKSSDARQYLAHLLSNTGRHAEALSEIDRALEIEPLSLRANAFRGMFLNNAGRTGEAIAQFEKTLELQPDFRLAQMFLARALIDAGRYEQSLSNIDQVRAKAGGAAEPRIIEATILALLSRKDEARQRLETLLKERRSRYVSNYGLATIYVALEEDDEAMNRLESSFQEKDLLLVFLSVDRRLDRLRSNSRFNALMQKLNLMGERIS
jgi:serine/threonine-protein kinase